MEKCNQKKCCFLGTSSCPICRECNAEPNVLDENCVACWNCSHDERFIRGSPRINFKERINLKEDEIEKTKEKLIEVIMGEEQNGK